MADDPQEPKPPNQQRQLPRLHGGTARILKRDNHLDGKIPTYWGPKQDGPDEFGNYQAPQDWHKAGTLWRVPRVVRWFWEAADLQTEVTLAMSFSGSYSFGSHSDSFDLDITGPPGVEAAHIHNTALLGQGASFYAIKFTTAITGHLDLGEIGGQFNASGSIGTWFSTAFFPPFILEDYEDRGSETYKAIGQAWSILSGGFTPAAPQQATDGAPPLLSTPDGPNNVGVMLPLRTGVYYINGIQYGERKPFGSLQMTIPEGWAQPPVLQRGNDSSSDWGALSDKMIAKYKGSTNPYFDAFPKSNGIDDFLSLVTPEEDGYFATRTVNFILLSTPHTMPDPGDPRIKRIKDAYPFFAKYVVVILLDIQNLTEQTVAGSLTATAYAGQMAAFVDGLSKFGWFIELVQYSQPDNTQVIIEKYIKDHLEPQLNDAPPSTA